MTVEAHEIKRTPKDPARQPNYKHVSAETLIDLYVNQGLSTHVIARRLGISQRQIYLKVKRLGIIDPSRSPIYPKGEIGRRLIDKDGYVKIFLPDNPNAQASGWVLEHRLVMSNYIGRPLLPHEVVHHKNEIKTDNHIDNLELFSSPGQHSSHRHIPAASDEKMLDDLRMLYGKLGRPLKNYDLSKENGIANYETYRAHFGSARKACELAGVLGLGYKRSGNEQTISPISTYIGTQTNAR